MAYVRFATKCDKCGRRSEEYSTWPECRVCEEHTCSNCDVPSQRTEDEANRTLCVACRDAEGPGTPGQDKTHNTLSEISYPEFCQLVLTAQGLFSYRFGGSYHVCDPVVYRAFHGEEHLEPNARRVRAQLGFEREGNSGFDREVRS